MRKFNKIFILVFAFVALLGCERQTTTTPDDDDTVVDVDMPQYGYIFFNTEKVSTRGELFDGGTLAGKEFSVLGYRYKSLWESEKTMACQNTSVTTDVKMGIFGNDAAPGVQKVTWNSGSKVHEYTPLKGWHASMKYAFFAWYPDTFLVANGGNATNYIGAPYVTYTLPNGIGSTRSERESMRDVMTACRIDYLKSDGLSVSLKMEHRLAVLDIFAVSMVNAKSLNEIWIEKEGFVSLPDAAVVTIDVSNLSLTLNGSIYKSVKIPLNTADDTEKMVALDSVTTGITCTGFDGVTGMLYYDSADKRVSLTGDNEKLILIPQTSTITAKVEGSYTIRCGELSESYPISSDNIHIYGLSEGVYHYLLLTFTKSGVFVQVAENETWINTKVEHEFN